MQRVYRLGNSLGLLFGSFVAFTPPALAQARPVDILIVMDNSGSMAPNQAHVIPEFQKLLDQLVGLDWQINVITTDQSCTGKLITSVDKTAQTDDVLTQALSVGTLGDSVERGFKEAHDSLALPCVGATWLRPDSLLSIIIVSDEDNCSYRGLDCRGEEWSTAEEMKQYLASIRTLGVDVFVNGIIYHPNAPYCSTGVNRGIDYGKLIQDTGGTWASICDGDLSPFFVTVGQRLRQM